MQSESQCLGNQGSETGIGKKKKIPANVCPSMTRVADVCVNLKNWQQRKFPYSFLLLLCWILFSLQGEICDLLPCLSIININTCRGTELPQTTISFLIVEDRKVIPSVSTEQNEKEKKKLPLSSPRINNLLCVVVAWIFCVDYAHVLNPCFKCLYPIFWYSNNAWSP